MHWEVVINNGKTVTVTVDHKALIYLVKSVVKTANRKFMRFILDFQHLPIAIQHTDGKTFYTPDMLSRIFRYDDKLYEEIKDEDTWSAFKEVTEEDEREMARLMLADEEYHKQLNLYNIKPEDFNKLKTLNTLTENSSNQEKKEVKIHLKKIMNVIKSKKKEEIFEINKRKDDYLFYENLQINNILSILQEKEVKREKYINKLKNELAPRGEVREGVGSEGVSGLTLDPYDDRVDGLATHRKRNRIQGLSAALFCSSEALGYK